MTNGPLSQRTRSMSWVARSRITPTSLIRCREWAQPAGSTAVDLAEIALLETARISIIAGLKRSTCPTTATSPRLIELLGENASIVNVVRPQASRSEHGCPRAASCNPISLCRLEGTTTEAASMPRSISSRRSCTTGMPMAARLGSPAGSATPTSSTPSICRQMRAWWRPIAPTPSTPTLSVMILTPLITASTTRSISVFGQVRSYGQRQHLGCGPIGLGQVGHCPVAERLLAMAGDRVVDAVSDAMFLATCNDRVATFAADRVLVIHVIWLPAPTVVSGRRLRVAGRSKPRSPCDARSTRRACVVGPCRWPAPYRSSWRWCRRCRGGSAAPCRGCGAV